ncbi:hypothetical protein, partial [Nitrosomonas sp.]|uniref:hypothetical protein n=1 Tax=Nitrosomonas sp. TaxID=42353 RepID=UPI0025EF63F7
LLPCRWVATPLNTARNDGGGVCNDGVSGVYKGGGLPGLLSSYRIISQLQSYRVSPGCATFTPPFSLSSRSVQPLTPSSRGRRPWRPSVFYSLSCLSIE